MQMNKATKPTPAIESNLRRLACEEFTKASIGGRYSLSLGDNI